MDQWIREQYKAKGTFGMTLDSRRSASHLNRKEQRNTLLKRFRNIPENMSPIASPMVSKVKQLNNSKLVVAKPEQKTNKRLEQLKKWKEEREKKKVEAKRKVKPPFKVFHVEHKEDLEGVYSTIKGKPIGSKEKAHQHSTNKNQIIKNNIKSNSNTKLHKIVPDKPKTNITALKTKVNVSKTKPVVATKTSKSDTRILKSQNSTTSLKTKGNKLGNKTTRSSTTVKSENQKEAQSSSEKIEEKTLKKGRKSLKKNEIEINTNSTNSENKNEERLVENNSTESDEPSGQQNESRRSRRIKEKENTQEETIPKERENKRKSILKTPVKQNRSNTRSTSQSDSNEDDVTLTPNNRREGEICYISPFVTMSRGKVAARKEYEQRKSLNGSFNTSLTSDGTDPRSPKAAASYFTKMLEDEIERIREMCDTWQNYKNEADLSEDACGLIDMTIGQSNLLITKKFKQFRGLIDQCRENEGIDMKIKCEDLHGFWDMMYKQVTDLDKRFLNLEDMKKNNWLEEEPKKKTPKVAAKGKKKKGAKKASKASSLLKETILAARRNRNKVNSEEDIEILVPKKSETPKRKSRNPRELNTPAKGILKSSSVVSEKRKTVAFLNLRESMEKVGSISSSARKSTPLASRRSSRLSLNRSKLTFDD